MSKRKTTEACVVEFKRIHGENRYDYSKVSYINNHTKVCIGCLTNTVHGFFWQTPSNHLNNQQCPICSRNKRHQCKPKNKNVFLKECRNLHGELYDYSNFIYNNTHTKGEIKCNKCWNIFYQTPNHHLHGQGCIKCSNRKSRPEMEFLDYLKIPNTKENRQKRISIFLVDGFDSKTNTIYEFLGDYWHGNPDKFKPTDHNQVCHKTFGELYEFTFNKKFRILKSMGYSIKYIWEKEWRLWKKLNSGHFLRIKNF